MEAELVIAGEKRQHVPKLITKEPPHLEVRYLLQARGEQGGPAWPLLWGAHHLLARIHSRHVMWRHEGDDEFMFCRGCAGWTGPNKVSANISSPCMGKPAQPSDIEKLLYGKVITKGKAFFKGTSLPVPTGVGTTSTRGSPTTGGADPA